MALNDTPAFVTTKTKPSHLVRMDKTVSTVHVKTSGTVSPDLNNGGLQL